MVHYKEESGFKPCYRGVVTLERVQTRVSLLFIRHALKRQANKGNEVEV